jgi:hypothetical protein
LNLKQGKIREAIKAFQSALNLGPAPKRAADIYRKIAQADLQIEDLAAAKKALDMAAENLKQAGEPVKNSSSPRDGSALGSGPTNTLPAKLIISAPKGLLDQVASGKIPYADFRRQATIDYFGLSASSKTVEMSPH